MSIEQIIYATRDLAELLQFIQDSGVGFLFVATLIFAYSAVKLAIAKFPLVAAILGFFALQWGMSYLGVPSAQAIAGGLLYGTISAFNLRIPQAVLGWVWRRLRPPQKAK